MASKFATKLTPPKTRFAGGYSSSGAVDPDEWADAIFGGVIHGPWLAVYMLRRFGWPNVGSDDYKNLCSWCLTTPVDGLYLVVTPYLGGGSNIHFGVCFTREVGAELDRDPEVEKHWQRVEKAIRRWWDREGADLYAIGIGDPEDVLVHEWSTANGETQGIWKRPENQKPHKLHVKQPGMFWQWMASFLEEKHPDVLPERKRIGERRPTAFQRRARKAIEQVLRDLLRPIYVRDVGFSPLGHLDKAAKYPPAAEPFEGAGNAPEYWFSQRRKRHERKAQKRTVVHATEETTPT